MRSNAIIEKYSHMNFLRLCRNEKDGRVRERLLALYHLSQGVECQEVARYLGRSDEWVRQWVLRFDEHGLDGLEDRHRSGRPKYLSDQEEKQVLEFFQGLLESGHLDYSAFEQIRDYILKNFQREYSLRGISKMMNRLSTRWAKKKI